jgi:DNA invertase Pin-like site-specific DNA recombinase
MSMSPREIAKLRKIVELAQQLLAKQVVTEAPKTKGKSAKRGISPTIQKRRSGKELASFRKMLKAERKQGVPVAEIATRYGISPAYVYQLR